MCCPTQMFFTVFQVFRPNRYSHWDLFMAHTSFLKFKGQALLSEMDELNDLASCMNGNCSRIISTILGVEGQTSLSPRHNNLHNNKQEAGEISICVFSGTWPSHLSFFFGNSSFNLPKLWEWLRWRMTLAMLIAFSVDPKISFICLMARIGS